MKKYLAFLFLTLLLMSLFFIKDINLIAKSVLHVFFYGVLPSLGPILLLSYLFIFSDGPTYLFKIGEKIRLKSSSSYRGVIIFLGLIAGTSSLAMYVNYGVKEKHISPKKANHILNSFATPSIPFLIALILYNIKDSVTKWWIFGAVLVINLFFYLLFSDKEHEIKYPESLKTDSVNPNQIFEKSIINTTRALIFILGTTILFSLLLILFNILFTNYIAISFLGFFEYSYSLSILLTTSLPFNALIVTAIVSFGSLASFLQIKWLCPSINFIKLVKTRTFIALFNVFLTYIFLLI